MTQNNSPIHIFKMAPGGSADKPRAVSEKVTGAASDRKSLRVVAEVGNPDRYHLLLSKEKWMGTS